MNNPIYTVVAIIVGAGLVGGFTAYLSADLSDEMKRGRLVLAKYLLLGILAAGAVPLFLSLVRSEVTTGMFADPVAEGGMPRYYEAYLIFAGICLIAGFSARRFIDGVSRQLLQRIDDAQQAANNAEKNAAIAKDLAAEATSEIEDVDANTPPPPEIETEEANEGTYRGAAVAANLTDDEFAALQALGAKTYRSRTGVAEDSKISRNRISEVLESLHEKKLAMPTRSPSTGGMRWIITLRGRNALDSRA